MMKDVRHPEITVELVGTDGNAFAILGRVRRAMRDAGLGDGEIRQMFDEAMHASDYQNLLSVVQSWVSVE